MTGMPGKGPVKASPNKAAASQTHHTNTLSVAQPSSTTQPSSHSRAHADSSKKEKVSVHHRWNEVELH